MDDVEPKGNDDMSSQQKPDNPHRRKRNQSADGDYDSKDTFVNRGHRSKRDIQDNGPRSNINEQNVQDVLAGCLVDCVDLSSKAYCLRILNPDDIGKNWFPCRHIVTGFQQQFKFKPDFIVFLRERNVSNPRVTSISLFFKEKNMARVLQLDARGTPNPDNPTPRLGGPNFLGAVEGVDTRPMTPRRWLIHIADIKVDYSENDLIQDIFDQFPKAKLLALLRSCRNIPA